MSGDFLKNTFEKSKKCIKLTPSMSPALHLGDFLDVLAHLGVRRAVLLKSLRESDARCIVVPDRGTQVHLWFDQACGGVPARMPKILFEIC